METGAGEMAEESYQCGRRWGYSFGTVGGFGCCGEEGGYLGSPRWACEDGWEGGVGGGGCVRVFELVSFPSMVEVFGMLSADGKQRIVAD